MSREAWEGFLGHARQTLVRPRFDEGYRDWKFEIAAQLRSLIASRADHERWLPSFEAVIPARPDFRDHRADLPAARQVNWLRRWARTDPASVERALDAFADEERDPIERFALFEKATADAPAEARAWHAGIVAVGSLFNFALAPDSLPMMRAVFFSRVAEILGFGQSKDNSLVNYYARNLDFAREVGSRLEQAGLPIRDMVDVQSLIFIAGNEYEFWAHEEPEEVRAERTRRDASGELTTYLAVCAMYQNEAPYLREWIEFHRLVGVERFFLYDNGSTDNHREVLAPYLENGTVVLHEWPHFPGQMKANDHCVQEHRHDTRWIATLDIDEFLFSPTGRSLPEVLVDYEEYPGIGVNWAVFGTGGNRASAPGLLIETHLLRAKKPWTYIKNIVDPARVVRCTQAHAFAYTYRTAVDEHCQPIVPWRGRTQFGSVARLRINHYYLKSESEGRAKLETAFEGTARPFSFDELDRELSEEYDDLITRYAPAIKDALAQTPSEVPS